MIAGGWSPPFRELTPEEERRVVAEIDGCGAQVVWVGTGQPKQEQWMQRMRPRLRAPLLVGVGAAFDFHAGLVPQAPPWMQRQRPGVDLPAGARAAAAVAALRPLQPPLRGGLCASVPARAPLTATRPPTRDGSARAVSRARIWSVFDDAVIHEAGRRMLQAAPPGSRVILFGSHARGEASEHSDLDFLVIEPTVQD